MIIAVAGLRVSPTIRAGGYPFSGADMCWGPRQVEGPNYMEEVVVTVGRAGRLSITPRQNVPWYEGKTTALHRMQADYRHLRVIP